MRANAGCRFCNQAKELVALRTSTTRRLPPERTVDWRTRILFIKHSHKLLFEVHLAWLLGSRHWSNPFQNQAFGRVMTTRLKIAKISNFFSSRS